MSVRFRIRTPQGQELSFASQAVFVEFVRSGDLAPEDLVYDGETNEWAPARTHPLVLEIRYEEEERAEVAARAAAQEQADAAAATAIEGVDEPEAGEPTAAAPGLDLPDPPAATPPEDLWSGDLDAGDAGARGGLGDLGLDLALPAEGPSPEEEAAAFLRKMDAERAMDLDARSGGGLGIRMEDSGSLAGMIAKPDSPTTSERPEPRAPEPRPRKPRARAKVRARAGPERAEPPKREASGALLRRRP